MRGKQWCWGKGKHGKSTHVTYKQKGRYCIEAYGRGRRQERVWRKIKTTTIAKKEHKKYHNET